MFNKKNNKTKTENEYLELVKFHTMKDDLSGGDKSISEEEINVADANYNANAGSPFLGSVNNNSVQEVKTVPEQPKTQNVANSYPHIPTPKESNFVESKSDEKMDLSQMDSEKRSSFGYVVIVVIILLLGAGGYYLWSTKGEELDDFLGLGKNTDMNIGKNNNVSEDSQSNDSANTINDLSGDKSGFSDKVNFMVISDEDFNQAGIKKVLDNKFIEMEKYNSSQVEFLMVDKNNKPISFKDFANNFKITLGVGIIDNLFADNFSLFLYRNNDVKRISMVMSVKDENLLKMNLIKSEKLLVKNLDSLFAYSKPDNSAVKQFGQSEYNGTLIRYVNLNKDLNLSLDYSISSGYLVFATNKDSGRLIIDKISKESTGKKDIFSSEK